MNLKDSEFLKRLLSTFKIEADEHLRTLSSKLIELERTTASGNRMDLIETVFREVHSLKGAARAVNLTEIEAICQALESVCAALKLQELPLSADLFNLLYRSVDSLTNLLSSLESERTDSERPQISDLISTLEGVLKVKPPKSGEEEPKKAEENFSDSPQTKEPALLSGQSLALTETVRIETAKLNSILLQAEELISVKLTSGQRASELKRIKSMIGSWKKEWAKLQPDMRLIKRDDDSGNQNGLGRIADFLEWNRDFIQSLETGLGALSKSAEHDQRYLGAAMDHLLEDMKKVSMLPFSSILDAFPRLVRDLTQDQDKEAELLISGEGIEIDRRILEEIKDPLIHIVRNSIDHGIENPSERERKNKPSSGTVILTISQKDSSKVEVLVSDDGAGIDVGKVKESAAMIGVLSRDEADKVDEREALSLIFESGVSTSQIITNISGRGLGLAIVREKVEKLGGTVLVETQSDVGASFRLLLPVTLATFRGVVVRIDERLFVLPATNVERVFRSKRKKIKTVENREVVEVGGEAISLAHLSDVLEIPRTKTADSTSGSNDALQLILLFSAESRIAFVVDEVVSEQEVLVKSLGKQLSRGRNISAATVLGMGRVALILNVPDLIKSAINMASPADRATGAEMKVEAERRSILVAEDSITSRTLLKNILESAGYEVKVAVDGVDAFTILRSEKFDLVVSDVDMPRMNGFDLTAKIRSDKRFEQLPVVLVTALDSRADRERGIDVGANAYIVKSSFDQSNLLEVIRRVI